MFSVGEVLGKAWEDFTRHWVVLILAVLISMGVGFGVQFVLGLGVALVGAVLKSEAALIVMQLGTNLLGMVINTFFLLGGIRLGLKAIRDEEPEIGDLFSQAHRLVQGVIAQLLITIAVVVAMVPIVAVAAGLGFAVKEPIAGVILAIVLLFPASFLVYALTMLTQFFVVDRELDAISALKASFDAGRTSLASLILLFLAIAGLMFVGFLACILPAFFVVGPLVGLATCHVYEQLSPLAEA